jgi:mannose-6-phosphate isomerase
MYLLENTIQNYAWGSRTTIAELVGRPVPSARPEAELWMGAHPSAPSELEVAGTKLRLDDWIAGDPEGVLGRAVAERFGPRLPFLLKVLAADRPLSLQAHPNQAQAEAGFSAERARGVPLSDPTRNYKDRHHKPELLCALGPFHALCGFRHVTESLRLFDELAIPALNPYLEGLRAKPNAEGLRSLVGALLHAGREVQRKLAEATAAACARQGSAAEFAAEYSWGVRIAELYPEDVGIVTALLLNLIRLEPGQAVYLPAGNLHAYLEGAGVEIMANSDNVLRGGLTPKHVDVGELLAILDFESMEPTALLPEPVAPGELAYATPAPEFRLSQLDVEPTRAFVASDRAGPEILLVVSGGVHAESDQSGLDLSRGQSAFVPASAGGIRITGQGRVFRARVNTR